MQQVHCAALHLGAARGTFSVKCNDPALQVLEELSRAYGSAQYACDKRHCDAARHARTAVAPECGRASDRFRWAGEAGRAVSGAGCRLCYGGGWMNPGGDQALAPLAMMNS